MTFTTETIVAASECWFFFAIAPSMEVMEIKLEFLPCSRVAFSMLHFKDSGGIGVRGGSVDVPLTWLLGTSCTWLLIVSTVRLVFIGSDSFSFPATVVWFLASSGCWSFARDFNNESTRGDDVPWTLDESDDFVLDRLGWRCRGSSSAAARVRNSYVKVKNWKEYSTWAISCYKQLAWILLCRSHLAVA